MTIWILWLIVGSALISLGALALDRAAAHFQLPRRGVWLLAIVVVAIAPLVLIMRRESRVSASETSQSVADGPSAAVPPTAGGAPLGQPVPQPDLLPALPSPAQPSFAERARDQLLAADPWVAAIWLTSSSILVSAFIAALIRTWSARRGWVAGTVENCPVLITEDEGPAVVGVIRPRVVLPRWAIAFDPVPRTLLLDHEREHIRAGDPLALFAAAGTVVIFPWNVALWWMVRRLRLAIEIDCDARVIHKFGGAHEYGRMLLAVGEHYARPLPLATTLVDAPSALQTRIDAMTATPPARPLRASLPLLVGAFVVIAAVVNVPRPAPLAAMPALNAPWSGLSRQHEGTTVVLPAAAQFQPAAEPPVQVLIPSTDPGVASSAPLSVGPTSTKVKVVAATHNVGGQEVSRIVNGLEVVIEAEKKVFAAVDPIALRVTFRNTSPAAFRVPDQIQPPQIRNWTLNVEEVTTHQKFTGLSLPRGGGAAPRLGEIRPVPLQRGEAQSAAVTFQRVAFIEGAFSNFAAGNVFFEQLARGRGTPRGDEIIRATGGRGTAVPQEYLLPPGTYSVSVTVQFPTYPSGPNLPDDIQAEIARLERDPVPMWKGGTIQSNSVEIRIDAPPSGSGSISGNVLDADGKPAAGVAIAYQTATELRSKAESRYNSPNPGSAFAQGIAQWTAAQKQEAIENAAKINPTMIYVGGTPAGVTDASGSFTIEGLPSDTYVVSVANRQIRQSGSQQPIVLKDGDQMKLATPIKMKRDPGPGGAGR